MGDKNLSVNKNFTREDAYALLKKYIKSENLIKHSLAAEAAMKGIYNFLHQDNFDSKDEKLWGITGLLHDIDYEIAQEENLLDRHGMLFFDRNKNAIPEPIAHAIKSHNYTKTEVDPETDLDWAIACVDQLTGLVVSSALISPNKKLNLINSEFVLKRFETPSFSRKVDRENIRLCDTKLNIPLKEFIKITLSSMQKISKDLGL